MTRAGTTVRACVAGALLVAAAGCSAGAASGASPPSAAASAGRSSAGSSAGSQVQAVTVHAGDRLRFSPATIDVRVGTVRVTLVDDGSYPHNLSVPALHLTSATVSGTPGEQRTTFTLRFAAPGRYPFVCTFHAAAGMRGTFVVRA